MDMDLLKSLSVWATHQALAFRNPTEPGKVTCGQVVRIALVEFPVIPLLIVASLVEGVVRGLPGLVIGVPCMPAMLWLDDVPKCVESVGNCALKYGAYAGLVTLANTMKLVFFFIYNVSSCELKERDLKC